MDLLNDLDQLIKEARKLRRDAGMNYPSQTYQQTMQQWQQVLDNSAVLKLKIENEVRQIRLNKLTR